MKIKSAISNYLLTGIVLFSILFQYVHSYEHLAKQLSEKTCFHKYNSSKEITHQHHNYDHCFVCDFTISNYIFSNISAFNFKKTTFFSSYFYFKSREITQFFKGSLFALRAPPIFIV